MRRAPLVIGATAAGLAAILSFRTQSVPLTLNGASGSTTSKSSSTSTVASGTPPSTSGSGSKSTSTGSNSSTTTSSTGTRSATGSSINYFYGVLSVKVTVSGSRITNVSIASLNDGGNYRSQSIDQQSIPMLEQQVLQAQSANIQGVSGATYTSAGFDQSLQSALKKLGL